jgi:microcystin-dependent protein
MASTYANDLRLEEIGSGDQTGTWGDTTNTNLELIAEAMGFGTEATFDQDANKETVIADGTTDPVRAMYFKVTSTLNLTATRTLTIAPLTINRVMYIENGTTGSQSISVKQGSGNEVIIPTGQTKLVYLDGAGTGAAVAEIGTLGVTNLSVSGGITSGNTTVGTLDTSGAVNLNLDTDSTSSTSGALIVDGGVGIAKKLFVGTDLDVDGITNLDAVDIDGAVQLDSTLTVGIDDTGYDVKFFGDTASAYMQWDASEDDLILGGAAGLVVPQDKLTIGSTPVTSTGDELNILDGVTADATEINQLTDLTRGSILYGNASGETARLAKGAAGTVLTSDGTDLSFADLGTFYPVGGIVYHAANTAPSGYLKANGAEVSRSTYSALFTAIGTTFGAGDDSTTFLVPDLRGEFMRGWDDGREIDADRVFGSAQAQRTNNFSRARFFSGVTGSATSVAVPMDGTTSPKIYSGGNVSPLISLSFDNRGGETRSRNIALLACIKY